MCREINAYIDQGLELITSSSNLPNKTKNKKVNRSITLDNLADEMNYIKAKGPNTNAESKMRSIEQNNRFRLAVRSGKLSYKSLLSHRLFKLEPTDLELLKGLENDLGEEQFRLPTRLLKLYPGLAMLVDRGYRKHAVFYPFFNRHIYPSFLDGRKQFEWADMCRDIDIKRLRYTSEVVFARTVCCRLLSSKIKVEDFPILDDAMSWSYGMANLYKPLRLPGDWEAYLNTFQ